MIDGFCYKKAHDGSSDGQQRGSFADHSYVTYFQAMISTIHESKSEIGEAQVFNCYLRQFP